MWLYLVACWLHAAYVLVTGWDPSALPSLPSTIRQTMLPFISHWLEEIFVLAPLKQIEH